MSVRRSVGPAYLQCSREGRRQHFILVLKSYLSCKYHDNERETKLHCKSSPGSIQTQVQQALLSVGVWFGNTLWILKKDAQVSAPFLVVLQWVSPGSSWVRVAATILKQKRIRCRATHHQHDSNATSAPALCCRKWASAKSSPVGHLLLSCSCCPLRRENKEAIWTALVGTTTTLPVNRSAVN